MKSYSKDKICTNQWRNHNSLLWDFGTFWKCNFDGWLRSVLICGTPLLLQTELQSAAAHRLGNTSQGAYLLFLDQGIYGFVSVEVMSAQDNKMVFQE